MKRAALVLMMLAGCTVRERYTVSSDNLRALSQRSPQERESTAVPATRRNTHQDKNVFVRGSTLDLTTPLPPTGPVAVVSSRRSKMVLAGEILTFVGTGISIAGSVLFFGFSDHTRHWTGGSLALSAESIMWTGTGLWIAGQRAHPQEVRAAEPGVQYLSP